MYNYMFNVLNQIQEKYKILFNNQNIVQYELTF
jgi:hypothetical protein